MRRKMTWLLGATVVAVAGGWGHVGPTGRPGTHIGGSGEPEKLAAGVKAVWDAIKKVRAERPEPATRFAGKVPTAGKVSAKGIEKALGRKSETQGGVVKVTIGREGTMHGVKVSGS